jgi:hypothetical protein
MTPRIALPALALALVCLSGCALFKRSNRAKESSAISSEIEASFHQRWVDQRTAELVARGVPAEAARTQASNEFRERFSYMRAGRK